MQRHALAGFFFLSSATGLLLSCGGAVGAKVRPQDITGAVAMNRPVECGTEPRPARPLVVDLDSPTRVDLQAALQAGVVVVAYDCKSLRVLDNCHVEGGYKYASVSRKEDVVQMKNQDDVSVNLPLSAGKVGAKVTSGNSIDLALVLVGLQSTTVDKVAPDALTGSCEGATHFVQKVSLGAFSMATGSAGKAMAVADLFKVSASGSSEATRQSASTDGSLEACRKADPEGATPTTDCKSPVSIQLSPIAHVTTAATPPPKVAKVAADAPSSADAPTKPPPPKKPAPTVDACPPGSVLSGNACTRNTESAHLCAPSDVAECKVQCEKGSAASCFNYASGDNKLDAKDVVPWYRKACDAGIAEGCGGAGWMLYDGVIVEKRDAKKNVEAVELAKKGCTMGGPEACRYLGFMISDPGPLLDLAAAAQAYDRACKLGSQDGCIYLAGCYAAGEGVAQDLKKAADLYSGACDTGDWGACTDAAATYTKPPVRDLDAALKYAKKACLSPYVNCGNAVAIALKQNKDAEAFTLATSACDRDAMSCDDLARLYTSGRGVTKDAKKAREYWKKSCDAGGECGDVKKAAKPKKKK